MKTDRLSSIIQEVRRLGKTQQLLLIEEIQRLHAVESCELWSIEQVQVRRLFYKSHEVPRDAIAIHAKCGGNYRFMEIGQYSNGQAMNFITAVIGCGELEALEWWRDFWTTGYGDNRRQEELTAFLYKKVFAKEITIETRSRTYKAYKFYPAGDD